MGHNVGCCFNLIAVFMAPSRPLLRLQLQKPFPFMPGGAVPRHQAANVVGQVLQADLGARPHHANRAPDPTPRRAPLPPAYMLDTRAYPALGGVRSLLRRRQRVVAPTASVNPALVTAALELGLDLS